jgi:hypothetical protein
VKAAMTQVGSDVVLTLSPTDAIKFLGTTVDSFTAENVLLAVDRSRFVQTFNDDFDTLSLWDGKSGGAWRPDYGWGNDRNNPTARTLSGQGEKQLYVDDTLLARGSATETLGINPFSIDKGILTIHAAPTPTDLVDEAWGYKFTSGLLSTRNSFTQTYGYFEARMELPAGGGAWPAFWLYTGATGSELDVMESKSGDLWGATIHDYATARTSRSPRRCSPPICPRASTPMACCGPTRRSPGISTASPYDRSRRRRRCTARCT